MTTGKSLKEKFKNQPIILQEIEYSDLTSIFDKISFTVGVSIPGIFSKYIPIKFNFREEYITRFVTNSESLWRILK